MRSLATALAAVFVLALLTIAPSTGSAQTPSAVVRYAVDLTFADGGTASGSFDFDPTISCVFSSCHTSGAFSNISITTTAWTPASGATCSTQFPGPRTYTTGLSNVTEPTRLAFSSPLNFWIVFDAPLGATGSVAVTLGGSTEEWSGAGCNRIATSPTVVGALVSPPTTTTTTTTSTTTVPTGSTVPDSSTTTSTPAATTVAPPSTAVPPTGPMTTIASRDGSSGKLPATGSNFTAITALIAAALVGLGFVARRAAS